VSGTGIARPVGTIRTAARQARDAATSTARRLDARLVAPGAAWRMRWLHALVSAVICWRLLARDWTVVSQRPDALTFRWHLLGWVPHLPAWAVVALQVIGVAGAVAAIARRRPRFTFAVAWACYLVLCGVWASSGKVMHNDVLTVTVGAVLLFASVPPRGTEPRQVAVRWGWPPRAALAVVGVVYFLTGAQKLRHSGPAWAFGENMEWVLRQGTSPFGSGLTHAIADTPALPQLLAAGALLLELTAPLLLLVRQMRILFALAVALMHGSIWACLGIDYGAWVATVAAVSLPTAVPVPFRRRWRPHVRA
jgi:hypothetical protein